MNGVCGSAYWAACKYPSSYYKIQCCRIQGVERDKCAPTVASNWGQAGNCHDEFPFAVQGCGSSNRADCKNTAKSAYNELRCCKMKGVKMGDSGCTTVYGDAGDQIRCP